MRTAIIVIVIVLGIVLLGGMIRLGGVPIFARIDAVLGTNILMTAHDTLFFFMHSAHQTIEDESTRANRELKEFQEKPIGIDKKGHYRKLDDAASY
jgi:hypothetical protein